MLYKINYYQNLRILGVFKIPYYIGNLFFSNALCDLGVSVNLIHSFIFTHLGLEEMKPTTIILQLIDRSIKYPMEVVDDVLVKVDKFIFPINIVALDMEKDVNIPLLLGRPYLIIGKILIDVDKGQLILRVGMTMLHLKFLNF